MHEVLIEHNGSAEHTKIARKLEDMLEHYCDAEAEQIVGADIDKVTLYNEKNMSEIASFSGVPTKSSLKLHLDIMI